MSTTNEPENPQEPVTTPQQSAEPGEQVPPQPTQTARPAPESVWGPSPQQPIVDRTQLPPFNIMALIAFIGAFIVPVVGIVCGHIALAEYRKGLPERGREYAKAGLILGYIFTAIWLVLAIIWIVFAFTHFGHASTLQQGGRGGFGGGNGFGGGQGGRNFPIPSPRVTPNGGTGN